MEQSFMPESSLQRNQGRLNISELSQNSKNDDRELFERQYRLQTGHARRDSVPRAHVRAAQTVKHNPMEMEPCMDSDNKGVGLTIEGIPKEGVEDEHTVHEIARLAAVQLLGT